jgi:hypothetical protein
MTGGRAPSKPWLNSAELEAVLKGVQNTSLVFNLQEFWDVTHHDKV